MIIQAQVDFESLLAEESANGKLEVLDDARQTANVKYAVCPFMMGIGLQTLLETTAAVRPVSLFFPNLLIGGFTGYFCTLDRDSKSITRRSSESLTFVTIRLPSL
jgi:hypothetical protein